MIKRKDIQTIFVVGGILALFGAFVFSNLGLEEPLQEEYCTKADTGERLSFSDAQQIASASDCAAEGGLKETYMCNEVTGTWWIDLDVEKEMCNPACVINVATREAETNWRCTGLIE